MNQKLSPRRQVYDKGLRALLWVCAGVTCALLVFLIGYIFYRGLGSITWELLTTQTSYIKDTIGILPNILNTLYIILVAMVIVLPLGVGAAIYLTEYADNQRLVGLIEFAAETLTGIPSIIFGLVGMLFFIQLLKRHILPSLEFYNACSLIKQFSSLFRLSVSDLFHLSLSNDRISFFPNTSIEKKLY